MSDTNPNTAKKTRGRPPGAGSFQSVSVQSLVEALGANTVIPVSRIFLEKQKITVVGSDATRVTVQSASVATPESQPEVAVS